MRTPTTLLLTTLLLPTTILAHPQNPETTLNPTTTTQDEVFHMTSLPTISSSRTRRQLFSTLPTNGRQHLFSSLPSPFTLPTTRNINTILPTDCPGAQPPTLSPLPTIPPALLSTIAAAAMTATDRCANYGLPTVTGSLAPAYTSFRSEFSEWWESYTPVLKSWASVYTRACPEREFYFDLSACEGTAMATTTTTAVVGESTGAGRVTGTGTSAGPTGTAGQESGGGTTGTESPGAAARQTGFVAAAGMVAGLVGVVAVL